MSRLSALSLVALLVSVGASAATFEVTSVADSGPGTLRQAILDANAAAGTDTISFAAGLDDRIELESALPYIYDGVSLVGPGADEMYIDANGHGGALVFGPVAGTVTSYVCCVTLTGGNTPFGGGLFVGGGHSVSVSNAVFYNNTAYRGGGIYNNGRLGLSSSAVYSNDAEDEGSGLYNNDDASLTRTTFTRNSFASGATGPVPTIRGNGSSIELDGVTVWSNSGGPALSLADTGTLAGITNTIVAGSTGDACTADLGVTGGHNLDDDGTCGFDGVGDLPGTDPQLAPLPIREPRGTWVVPPWRDLATCLPSPVVDTGDGATCTNYDQGGTNGPRDGDGNGIATCDIGAYELPGQLTVANLADSGSGSLRTAVETTNDHPGPDTIRFCDAVDGIVELTSALPTMTGDVTIEGPGADRLWIDANDTGRVLHFQNTDPDAYVRVNIRGVTLRNGQTAGWGGGILFDGVIPSIEDIEVFGNEAGLGGGGIAVFYGPLIADRIALIANTTDAGLGGGVYMDDGNTIVLRDSTVANNLAFEGAGIWADLAAIIGSTVVWNHVVHHDHGAGVYISGTHDFEFGNSIIADNSGGAQCNRAVAGSLHGPNLDSDGSCGFNGPDDLPSTDPLLLAQDTAGGPTHTIVLDPYSPAIDAGSLANCGAADQRGFARPVDADGDDVAECDMGAWEFTPLFVGSFEVGTTDRWSAVVN